MTEEPFKLAQCRTCSHTWRLRRRDIRMDNGTFLMVNVSEEEKKDQLGCADCMVKFNLAHVCTRVMRDVTPLPWQPQLKGYFSRVIP